MCIRDRLELIEPSFYFHVVDGGAERFADALVTWLAERGLGE